MLPSPTLRPTGAQISLASKLALDSSREARYSQFALEQTQIIFVLERGTDYSGELYNVELRARHSQPARWLERVQTH